MKFALPGILVWLAALFVCALPVSAQPLDTLVLGSPASEQAHNLKTTDSDTVTGGLGEPARRLLPHTPQDWRGGTLSFTLKSDPNKVNYVTARLWGSDVSEERLLLFLDGKQIGYRHLGDVDLLDTGGDHPAFLGRFYYTTTPLPLGMTQGKTSLSLEIRAEGPIFGYAGVFDQYQKTMTEPTRGIYRVYSHSDPCFVPPAGEKQGAAPRNAPVRRSPGPEVLDAIEARVNRTLAGELSAVDPLNQQEMHLLTRAFFVPWSVAYHNPQVTAQVIKGVDHLFALYQADPKEAQSDPAMYNGDWFGLGWAGDCVQMLAAPLQPSLDEPIGTGQGTPLTRRAAWLEMFQASRDWHRRHRPQYSAQSMIVDMNTYTANRAVEAIDPAHALPESKTLQYLYQSMGMTPWSGNDTDQGPDYALGHSYYELTPQGLTKELGYVGYYGEVLDWATQIYDATRPAPGLPGDPKIKAQLVKLARARAVFRAPLLDPDGNRAMGIEAIVGWRDEGHYPGDLTYGERPTWDASALYTAAATLDPYSVGYAQQMFADNQFFASAAGQAEDTGSLRVTAGLLGVPEQYAAVKAQPPSPQRLPMSPGHPDFVWTDEEDGVLAVKHGDEIFYASLYWRARYGINSLARIHDTLPAYDRIGTVQEDEEFEPTGLTYTRQDWTNFGFGGGGLSYPAAFHSALAGEKLPIAKIPDGVSFHSGDESPYAGRASFYHLRYGDYLIGMNSTADKTFILTVPAGVHKAVNVASGRAEVLRRPVFVGPMSTVVLYLEKNPK